MSDFQLTAEQARATRPDAHIWVDASAGTGKTHVLTARVLRLMVEGARPDSILCLTYTKAAAGEMVNRILTRLGAWAMLDDAALTRTLAVLLGGASLVTPEHKDRARQLFLKVLDLPGGLNVQTLHAFAQSLLGRFPIEAATAPAFETIDDRTAKEFAADARDAVLTAALEAGSDSAIATQTLARLLADSSFDATIAELLSLRAVIAKLPSSLAGLRQVVHQVLGADMARSQRDILLAACEDARFDKAALADVLTAINASGTAKEKAEKAPTLQQWLSSKTAERTQFFDTYASLFLTAKGTPRSPRTLLTKAVQSASSTGLDAMMAEGERILRVREAMALKQLAEETSYALLFGQHLIRHYSQRKDRAGKLDYDDLIERTQALLGAVPAAWVMYRLDAQIDHILIDEAQDNSSVQWDIVRHLSEEFFVGEGYQEGPRSVFAVGDMKQSIYGFQGAQPQLFHASRDGFTGKAKQVRQPFDDIQLSKSFRSVSAVLDVVDETFAGTAGDGLDARRVRIKHDTHRKTIGGMVDLWPLSLKETREKEEEPGWRLPLQERWEKKGDRLLAERIAKDIDARIKAGERLPARAAPLTAGDFLILVRQRGDLMSHLARALRQRGVPIAGVDRFDLKSPLAVRDLVNLARFASLPSDDFALACVLKSPLCNVTEAALITLCSERSGSLWEAAKASDLVSQEAKAMLSDVLARADYVAPYELFSGILEAGARQRLLERLGNEADDAITVFLGQCLHYESDHTPSLDGFLHWFGQSDVDVKRDPEAAGDKVRLMTIHGAKGLQAPVVYLADLAGKPKQKGQFVLLESHPEKRAVPIFRRRSANDLGPVALASAAKAQADYEEYKRLLYVAMTRAEDHLICAGYAAKAREASEEDEPDAYDLITHAFDRMKIEADAETGVRRYKVEHKAALPADTSSQAPEPTKTRLPDWAKRPPAPDPIPPKPLQPSDVGGEQAAPFSVTQMSDSDLSPARRGSLIHALLQHLPNVPEAQRLELGQQYLERMLEPEKVDLAPSLLEQTLATLSLLSAAPFFGADSRAEVPIVARLGPFMVSGQVDRMAVTEDAVLFADFKTSGAPPSTFEETPPAILRQMALYQASLEQVFTGKSVKGALIWTVSGTVQWLERTDLLKHLPPSANTAFTGVHT